MLFCNERNFRWSGGFICCTSVKVKFLIQDVSLSLVCKLSKPWCMHERSHIHDTTIIEANCIHPFSLIIRKNKCFTTQCLRGSNQFLFLNSDKKLNASKFQNLFLTIDSMKKKLTLSLSFLLFPQMPPEKKERWGWN